ncbi:MAG: hypothetical protein ACPG5T_03740, partial [Endozoicomonas sp.]
ERKNCKNMRAMIHGTCLRCATALLALDGRGIGVALAKVAVCYLSTCGSYPAGLSGFATSV